MFHPKQREGSEYMQYQILRFALNEEVTNNSVTIINETNEEFSH